MKKIIVSMLCSYCFLYFSPSWAELIPREVSADRRIKIVNYDANNVVIVKGKYGYQTQIVFAPSETVQNVSIGDSMAWQAVPVNNNLFIKPMAASKTNMTILTNTNSYNFQLDSSDAKAMPTYKLQFIYPHNGDAADSNNATRPCNGSLINWKYSYTGERLIAPAEAFDCDNKFTYFRFSGAIPAIFSVDKDRNETLVNYHMVGSYVAVNAVANQFTLRNGSYVTSVYNDGAIGDWQRIK